MKKKKVIIHIGGKKIKLFAEDCNFFEKFIGLMFSEQEKARILLFSFKTGQKIRIHSFFVFYPFIAIWLDKKNKIVDIKKVKPFTLCVSPEKPSFSLVEIPINKKNKGIIKRLAVPRR